MPNDTPVYETLGRYPTSTLSEKMDLHEVGQLELFEEESHKAFKCLKCHLWVKWQFGPQDGHDEPCEKCGRYVDKSVATT